MIQIDVYNSIFSEYPDVVNVVELCEMLGGISQKTAYHLLNNGEISSLKVGRAYKIPKINVLEYLGLLHNSINEI